MVKILITGGLGLIGSNSARKLVNDGYNIRVLDNRNDLCSIADIQNSVEFIHGDVRDISILKEAMIGIDGVIHLAALSRVIWGYQRPEECLDINVQGTRNVVHCLKRINPSPWIIFGSSREVYGEPDFLPCPEDAPYKSPNIYAVGKIAGEMLINRTIAINGVRGAILRFSNVYGSIYDQLDRVIPKFILNAFKGDPLILQGGEQVLDFTHIDDVTIGILKVVQLLDEEKMKSGTYHLVTGRGTTITDLADYVIKKTGSDSTKIIELPRTYDVQRFIGDPKKVTNEMNITTKISMEKGISKFIKEINETQTILNN